LFLLIIPVTAAYRNQKRLSIQHISSYQGIPGECPTNLLLGDPTLYLLQIKTIKIVREVFMAQYTEASAVKKSCKTVEVTLQFDEDDMEKLKHNPMPAWVMGEKIAEKLIKGAHHINVNLKDTFDRYRV
jgi:hypothetical protein